MIDNNDDDKDDGDDADAVAPSSSHAVKEASHVSLNDSRRVAHSSSHVPEVDPARVVRSLPHVNMEGTLSDNTWILTCEEEVTLHSRSSREQVNHRSTAVLDSAPIQRVFLPSDVVQLRQVVAAPIKRQRVLALSHELGENFSNKEDVIEILLGGESGNSRLGLRGEVREGWQLINDGMYQD